MKCEYCPANVRTSYEYAEYDCYAGVPEEDQVEFKDGLWGCRHPRNAIEKRIAEHDSQYEGIGEWYQEEQRKERAMRAAIKSAFEHEELVICYKRHDGTYAEADEYAQRELPDWLRWAYEEELEKTKEE